MRGSLIAILVTWILVACTGCGSGTRANRDPVYPVSGKLIYKGAPVESADVTFICEEKQRSAFARTDSQGRFKLTTFAPNDGAVAGKQLVVVRKIDAPSAEKEPDIKDPSYDPNKVAQRARRESQAPPPNQIPLKYSNQKTTDLFAVVSEKNPEMVLELKD